MKEKKRNSVAWHSDYSYLTENAIRPNMSRNAITCTNAYGWLLFYVENCYISSKMSYLITKVHNLHTYTDVYAQISTKKEKMRERERKST